MKYFTFSSSIDIDAIGVSPQVSPTQNCVLGSPFSTIRLKYGDIPEEIPYLELELNKNAKKTDLLNSYNSHFGMITSEKLKQVILNFNIPKYKFYPFTLLKNKINIQDYYLFRFYDDIFHYIDMNKSKFSIKRRDAIEEFSFKSKEFFLNKSEETFSDFEKTIRIEKIYLLNSFPKYDLFEFESFIFISEQLLNSFKDNSITGFEVKESKMLFL